MRHMEIGGGLALRGFNRGTGFIKAGTQLSAELINSIPFSNRRSMIDRGIIAVHPPIPVPEKSSITATGPVRMLVDRGFGKFDVVAGTIINDAPLTKADALALAGFDPEPDAPKSKRERKKH